MTNTQIRESCFNLSISLMWEKQIQTIEQIEGNLNELNEMTENFYNSAMFYLVNIESLYGKDEIIIRAINYINEVHVIPPLRGNYAWFEYTLGAVLELACPNSRLSKKNLNFLNDIESGIKDYRENSLSENEI